MVLEELSDIKFETLNSIKSFSQKLCQPLHGISVIVIIISSRDELRDFMALLSVLENIRVILILPDRGGETIALGLKLNPSFISYVDNDLMNIIDVLKKIQAVTKEKKLCRDLWNQ
jgi:hypothetical protein